MSMDCGRIENKTAPSSAATADAEDDDNTFTCREYQEQIIEQALKRNIIIFLPTGAGKTYIALQTIKRMSESLEK